MDLVDYLKVLQRRWRFIAIAVVLAAAAGFVTAPAPHKAGTPVTQPGVTYKATATLLPAATGSTTPVNTALLDVYIQAGDIATRAAQALGYQGDPTVLASGIQLGGDKSIQSLTITDQNANPTAAAKTANAFADATVAFLRDQSVQTRQQQIQAIAKQLAQLKKQIEQTPADANGEHTAIGAAHDALVSQYGSLYGQQQQLAILPPPDSPLTILHRAVAVPVASTTALPITAPKGRISRVLIALLAGLIIAVGVALVLERFDTRLRTRLAVEDAFRLPVVSELPVLPRAQRRVAELATVRQPESAAAEAYRAIRSALYLMPSLPIPRISGGEPAADVPLPMTTPKVVLVTSTNAESGKTRTAANLASCIAETGKSVLVLDCDLRNPSIGKYFDVDSGWGLTDLLANDRLGDLALFTRRTTVQGVGLVTAGASPVHPAVLLARMHDVLDVARQLADVVVIDSPPIIGTSDALDLMPHVDTTLVVAWAGRTRREPAKRSAELLSRLSVPVLGVALISQEAPTGYSSSGPTRRRTRGRRIASRRGELSSATTTSVTRGDKS